LQIVALARHADRDVPDAAPRVEPAIEGVERRVRWRTAEPGEAERRYEEPAALVEHPSTLCPAEHGVNA